ncbi:leucine rich repeats and iq motif containing 4 [Anaeramoeba flamelloides]|uniref:Leucine rich repeats and iq motif containing 4 n=1 Tax=Anaeramoeba flamelloides TaxID=1746091 RepID=A0ABQ8Z722_9EUKA|nr:leucine rich repeats and iq motif containing 4 [Anaeramoeba flamelloides]
MTNEVYEEVEVLESIYEDTIEILQPTIEEKKEHVILNVVLGMKSNTLNKVAIKIRVSLKIFSTYPDSVPEIKIENRSGSEIKIPESEFEDFLGLMNENAEEMKGSGMIFNLVMVAQDFIDGLDDYLIVFNTIETLPRDLIVDIFSYIPNDFYVTLSCVCKRWNEILACERILWSDLWIQNVRQNANYFQKSSVHWENDFKFHSISVLMDRNLKIAGSEIVNFSDIFFNTNQLSFAFDQLEHMSLIRLSRNIYHSKIDQANLVNLLNALNTKGSKGLSSLALECVPEFSAYKIIQKIAKERFVSLKCNTVEGSKQILSYISYPNILETLELTHCGIKKVSESFFKFHNLKSLNLAHNPIKTLPMELFLSKSIESINLNNTLIYKIRPTSNNKSMPANNTLKKLTIASSNLTSWPPLLCKLLQLEILDISNNTIDTISNDIRNYGKMRCFNIANNDLTKFPIENVLASWPNVRYLNISKNKIADINVKNNIFTGLTVFHFHQNQITNFPLFYFTNTHLLKDQSFNVSKNQINDFSSIETNENLIKNQLQILFEEMNFNSNRLQQLPLILQYTKKLKTLKLSNNNLQNDIKICWDVNNVKDFREFKTPRGKVRLRIVKNNSKLPNNQKEKKESISKKVNKQKFNEQSKLNNIQKEKIIDNNHKISVLNQDLKFQSFDNSKAIFLNLSQTLTTLDLSYNKIKFFPKEILLLENLSNLNFSNNLLSEVPLEFIETFYDKLQVIDFSNNLMKNIPFSNGNLFLVTPKFLTTLAHPFIIFTKLRFISFSGNQIPKKKYLKFTSYFENKSNQK